MLVAWLCLGWFIKLILVFIAILLFSGFQVSRDELRMFVDSFSTAEERRRLRRMHIQKDSGLTRLGRALADYYGLL
ncbi:MAG TPA: hypothetical protein ENF42_00630 [Candidatus Bathyarchaeota archaeon]|nr:hypothetical protein [Candidatus Bathyarchaeota archaeon]